MKSLSSFFQFLLGFLLGVALLVGGTAALGYFIFTRMATTPEKPLFAEEKKTQPVSNKETTEKPKTDTGTKAVSPVEPEEPSQPSGSYLARVTWPQGLSLRAEPSIEATRIGGIAYNGRVLILGTSRDGQWQRVRLDGGQQEGWIKAGNVEKIAE